MISTDGLVARLATVRGEWMCRKARCSSSHTVNVPFGETLAVPSGHTVATNPSDCSRTTRCMSSSSRMGPPSGGASARPLCPNGRLRALPYAPAMSLPPPAPDRTCIITGASSGIGSDLARQLARRRYGVTLVARREERLRALAEELSAAHGVRADVTVCDLSDEADRNALAASVEKRGLAVDILVNNAGFSTSGPIHKSDPAREVAMIRTDVEAVAHLCSTFVPEMVARGHGAVLNVASVAAFQPLPGQAGYAAAKAFVLSYSRALAEEVRKRGVTVTALCPGPVETEFAEAAGLDESEAASCPAPVHVGVVRRTWRPKAIEGLEKGRQVVIPGAPNWIGAGVGHLTPRRLLMPLLASRHPSLKA